MPIVPSRSATRWKTIGACAVIFAATLLIYFPSLHGGLLWNDTDYVTAPRLQAWSGLGRIWFEVGATQQYYPVLHSAFWLEHRLWGDAAVGYHLLNVFLHAVAACLFAVTLRQVLLMRSAVTPTLGPDGLATRVEGRAANGIGWLAGALFALHPIG